MAASPSTSNYAIPTGKLEIKFSGDADFVDAGNVVNVQYTPTVTKQEHYASRGGARKKDKTVITQVGATMSMAVDEITGRNLAAFFLGTLTTDTAGDFIIEALTDTDKTADIRITGDNDVGPQITLTANVTFSPSGALTLIADNNDFQQIPLDADVNDSVTYGYGHILVTNPA